MCLKLHSRKRSFWWTLNGGNHQVLATSEMYSRARDARRAARLVALKLRLEVIEGELVTG